MLAMSSVIAQEGPQDYRSKAELYRVSNPDSSAYFYDLLGSFYRSTTEYDSAFENYMRSLKLREESGSPQVALSLVYIGIIENYRGEYDNALRYFGEALNVAEDTVYICYAYNLRGNVFATKAYLEDSVELASIQFDSAELSLKAAKRFADMHGMRSSWFNSLYINFGDMEAKRENYSDAMRYFQRVASNYRESGLNSDLDVQHFSTNLNNLGYMAVMSGALDSALYFYDDGLAIADSAGIKNLKQLIYTNKAAFYDSLRPNSDSLLHYLRLAHQLELEIRDETQAESINELQVRYDTERIRKQNAENLALIERNSAERRLLIIIVLVLVSVGLIGYIFNKRRMIRRDKEFSHINDILKEQEISSFNAVMQAQEKERKRIASELHDKLGSTLSAAKLYLNHLEEQQLAIHESKDYNKGMQLLDTAVQDVRTISHAMDSGVLGQFGLVAALKDLETTISGTGKIKMEVHAHGLNGRLPQNAELHVYRMIQELVSNALKHSHANSITVQLTQHENDLNVLVEDNGTGFDVHERGDGIGLQNIYHRADILGAKVNLDTFRGRGTVVTVDIPTP